MLLRRNLKKILSQTNRKAELEHWQRIRDSFQKQGTPSDMSRFIADKATTRFRTMSSVQNCWLSNMLEKKVLSSNRKDIEKEIENHFKTIFTEDTPAEDIPNFEELKNKNFTKLEHCTEKWILDIVRRQQIDQNIMFGKNEPIELTDDDFIFRR